MVGGGLVSLGVETFIHYNKRCQELANVADVVETRGNILLCNIKTRSISMHAHVKRALLEYRALMLTMHQAINLNVQANNNLALLCDIECLLGLICLTPHDASIG